MAMKKAVRKVAARKTPAKKTPAKKTTTAKVKKFVYPFGGSKADGGAAMKNLLGGKGANLAEMCLLGIPVPAGFTISTECCTAYYANGCKLPAELADQVVAALRKTEAIMGKQYGNPENPPLSRG